MNVFQRMKADEEDRKERDTSKLSQYNSVREDNAQSYMSQTSYLPRSRASREKTSSNLHSKQGTTVRD